MTAVAGMRLVPETAGWRMRRSVGLALGSFRRRGSMVPKIDGSQWDDLDSGCTVYFESTVKAVLHEATIMRIV